MAWKHVYSLKDEGPRKVCWLAYYLAVHEVAQADEAGCDRNSNRDSIEDCPHSYLQVLAVEQQGQDDANSASMTGKAFIACEMPITINIQTDGQQHLDEMGPAGQEISWFIEDAMSQTSSYKDSDEAIQKEWLELLIWQFLLSVQVFYYQVCQQKSYQPTC